MKIGIDATALTTPFPCGTKNYAQNLISALAKIDKKNEYLIFTPKKATIPVQKNFKNIVFGNKLPILKRQVFLTLSVLKVNPDVFHYLEPYGSIFFNNENSVVTLHDLDLKQTYNISNGKLLNQIYCTIVRHPILKRSGAIIVPSLFVKKELSKYIGDDIKRKHIAVVPEAVPEIIKSTSTKKSKITKKYFMAMGDFAPRKNVERVIRAFEQVNELHPVFELSIVCTNSKAANRFETLAKVLGLKGRVKVYQSIGQTELSKMYKNAIAFVYPSLYEGFGLPILEAMHFGCPVITSNFGAMKETAGSAAILVDPYSVSEIGNAMLTISTNARISRKLSTYGRKHSSQFSWIKNAQKTLSIYNKVYENRN